MMLIIFAKAWDNAAVLALSILKTTENSELCKIFAHIYAGSALPMHGHERPRDKGVTSVASLQQHKPHLA